MTCIVGISDGNNVYIGGDRAISDGDVILTMSRPKVGVRGDWIYGYAGDLGIGQLIELIDLPILDKNDDPYMVIMNEIIYTLHERIDHFIKNDEPQAEFLIGARGRLFELNTEAWGIAEVQESAIGSGSQYALGSLYTTYPLYTDIYTRAKLALESAIRYSPSCQDPIDIVNI